MNNCKVRVKLLVGFGFLMVLIIVLNGFSLASQRKLSNMTIQLYDEPYLNTVSAIRLARYTQEMDSDLKNMLLSKSTAEWKSDYQHALQEVSSYMQMIQGTESASGDGLVATFSQLKSAGQAVMDALDAGDYPAAQAASPAFQAAMDAQLKEAEQLSATEQADAAAFRTNAEKQANFIILLQDVLFVLIAAGAFATALRMSVDIAKPIRILSHHMKEVSMGNLSQEIATDRRDEFGILSQQLGSTVKHIKQYVDDISYVLGQISAGNIDLAVERDYIGEFSEIKDSLTLIIGSLNETMQGISEATDQIRVGSSSLAASAQTLAQGSAEQTAAVDAFQTSLDRVSTLTAQDSQNAAIVRELSDAAWQDVQNSNQQMGHMMNAMNDISNSSREIAKIIKLIEDIAFQTNILALNAAVEAARAGAAGKGFAVVADEVRNLAGKSAEAADSTNAMISKAVSSVDSGMGIAQTAATSISQVGANVQSMAELLKRIDESTNQQELAFHQMTESIGQITSVVHSNSAAAEENSSAADELSAQANHLEQLVQHFHFRNSEQPSYR